MVCARMSKRIFGTFKMRCVMRGLGVVCVFQFCVVWVRLPWPVGTWNRATRTSRVRMPNARANIL